MDVSGAEGGGAIGAGFHGGRAGGRRGARARDCRPRGAAAQRDQLRPPPVRQPNAAGGAGPIRRGRDPAQPMEARARARGAPEAPPPPAVGACSLATGAERGAQWLGRTVRRRQQGSAARSEGPRGGRGRGRAAGPGFRLGAGGTGGGDPGALRGTVPAGRPVQPPGPCPVSGVREAPRAAEVPGADFSERWDERAADLSLRAAEPGAGGCTVRAELRCCAGAVGRMDLSPRP